MGVSAQFGVVNIPVPGNMIMCAVLFLSPFSCCPAANVRSGMSLVQYIGRIAGYFLIKQVCCLFLHRELEVVEVEDAAPVSDPGGEGIRAREPAVRDAVLELAGQVA